MNAQQQIDAQVLELHSLIADEIDRRPDQAMACARETLGRWQSLNGDHPYYRKWVRLFREGPSPVIALIRDPGERATFWRFERGAGAATPIGSNMKDLPKPIAGRVELKGPQNGFLGSEKELNLTPVARPCNGRVRFCG